MQHPEPVTRRLFELTEPISLVNFFSEEPDEAMAALGLRTYWDGHSAGRAAPLGRVPAAVAHAARERGGAAQDPRRPRRNSRTRTRRRASRELDHLVASLEPVSRRRQATGSR